MWSNILRVILHILFSLFLFKNTQKITRILLFLNIKTTKNLITCMHRDINTIQIKSVHSNTNKHDSIYYRACMRSMIFCINSRVGKQLVKQIISMARMSIWLNSAGKLYIIKYWENRGRRGTIATGLRILNSPWFLPNLPGIIEVCRKPPFQQKKSNTQVILLL